MAEISSPLVPREGCSRFQSISIGDGPVLEFTIRKYPKERESSEYIRSWAGVTLGLDVLAMSYNMNSWSVPKLKFEIVSARTIISRTQKFVAYTIMISLAGDEEDVHPAILERRYTDIFNLYISLKREFPDQLLGVQFPKKAIVGNFSPEVISGRSEAFQLFLEFVGSATPLRNCPSVADFLQRRELIYALKLIADKQYDYASTLVENCFRVMNKLHTDRSPVVLRNLCLLICLYAEMNDPRAMELACLAVRRFQGVSDVDLLRYYVPLLNISLELSEKYGKDTGTLQEHLAQLRKRGVALHDSTPLLTLVLNDLRTSHMPE